MTRPGRREVLVAGTCLLAGCSSLPIAGSSDGGDQETGEQYPSWQYDRGNTGRAEGVTAPTDEPELRWEREIGPGNGGASPVIADGTLFVGDGADTFHALDLATGDTQWTARTNKWIHSTAAIDGDFLAFGCDDFLVRAFGLDGEERWTFRANFEVSAEPVVTEDRVYVTDTRSVVYALDRADGQPVWTESVETEAAAHLSSPVMGDDALYVGTETATYALDPDDGSTLWRTDDDRRVGGSPALADGLVVGATVAPFRTGTGTVYALDASTGDVRWAHDLEHRYPSDVAVVDDAVYVSDAEGIAARSTADGSVDWRTALGGPCGTPVVVDGTVYCGTERGIYALGTDGTVHWETRATTGQSGMAIADGTIVMKDGGRVFALR